MNFKDKMMDNMMGKMSPEERKDMMDKMMETFFANMTPEEKQDMMNNMMPKMMEQMMGGSSTAPGENPMMKMMGSMMGGSGPMMGGSGMMGMMEKMMGNGDKKDDFNPMDMCKEMMSNVKKSNDLATFATPEVRQLFEEWVQQVDEEVLALVKSEKAISPEKIAEKLKISKESVLYFLTRLAQKGKISLNISGIVS
jgi:hypothetical protein